MAVAVAVAVVLEYHGTRVGRLIQTMHAMLGWILVALAESQLKILAPLHTWSYCKADAIHFRPSFKKGHCALHTMKRESPDDKCENREPERKQPDKRASTANANRV